MMHSLRKRWVRFTAVIGGLALLAALLIGVSPYPTEVLGQTPPPAGSPPSFTFTCEGGTLVVTFTLGALPGLPNGIVRVTRVPLGSPFLCQFLAAILSGRPGSLFGRDLAPIVPPASALTGARV